MKYQFRSFIGQQSIPLMQRLLCNGTFPNFSIFEGVYGSGKTTAAVTCAVSLCCNSFIDEPCLKCSDCRGIIASLDKSGFTTNFKMINVPKIVANKDIVKELKEVFSLQVTDRKCVYVLEEAHALKNYQSILLEEIDHINKNVYVILTTTEIGDLSQPLKSRARIFHFSRINKSNTMLLLNRLCEESKVSLDSRLKELLCDYSKGVPRDLISLFDFVTKNQITLYELQNYLNEIDSEVFIELFSYAVSDNMAEFIVTLKDLVASNGLDVVIQQLKRFYLNVVFLIEGGIKENFTKKENELIIELLSGKPIYKIARIIEKLNRHSQEEDFFLAFINIWELMHNSTVNKTITEQKGDLLLQKESVKNVTSERKIIAKKEASKVEKMTEDDFLNYMNAFN